MHWKLQGVKSTQKVLMGEQKLEVRAKRNLPDVFAFC
jgi:hypothetical protein